MEIIRYKSETGRILELRKNEWYYKNKKILNAAFYDVGKNENLIKYEHKKITARQFLSKGDNPRESFCNAGYLYVLVGEKIKKTKTLTKITND